MARSRILVADDNPDILALLEMALKDAYEVHTAPDGLAAWARFEEVRPRLVITDLNMPGMNGLDFSEKIRAHPELGHTPIIILTGATVGEELPGGFWKIGTQASVFLEKPIELDKLLDTVRRQLVPRQVNPLPPGKGHY